MEVDPQQFFWPAALAIVLSLGICTAVVLRVRRGLPVVPYQPRRRVPWKVTDLVFVLVAGQVLGLCVVGADNLWFSRLADADAPIESGERSDGAHPLLVLLEADGSFRALLLVCVCAVVVAPIVEEFFFRLLFQGWLEAKEGHLRRQSKVLRRLTPGTLPVLTASLLFGAIHYRPLPTPDDPKVLVHMLASGAVARVLTMAFALWLVRSRAGATAADLGFDREKLLADVRLGLVAFAAVAAIVYAMKIALEVALPQNPINDPIALVFFAAVLGTLYYRTHRIVPSIVLHMALNATSIAMAWASLAG